MPIGAPVLAQGEPYRAICLLLADHPEQVKWNTLDQPDWENLVLLARREGVAPLVYWKLKRFAVEAPGVALQALASSYYMTAAENVVLYSELARILTAFGLAEIPTVVLKGAVLAQTIYPDPALRPMSDLDLLVLRKDIERASVVIRGLGYDDVAVQSQALNRRIGTQVNFLPRAKSGHEVELHWNLVAGAADRRSPDVSWFWTRRELWPWANGCGITGASILSPTAHLLYLIAHLALQHGGRYRLLWCYDLHLLITQCAERLDWDVYLQQVFALGWASSQLAGLEAARSRLGSPIPGPVMAALVAQTSPETSSSIRAARNVGEAEVDEHRERLAALNWSARIWYVLALLLPGPAFMRSRYPSWPGWLLPALYPARWLAMARRGATVLISWRSRAMMPGSVSRYGEEREQSERRS
jgi:hypothetical protein